MSYPFSRNSSPFASSGSGTFGRPESASQFALTAAQWPMGATGSQQRFPGEMENLNLAAFTGSGTTPFPGMWNAMGAWGSAAAFSPGTSSGTPQNWTGSSWNKPEARKGDKSRDTRSSEYGGSFETRGRGRSRSRKRRSAERSRSGRRDDLENDRSSRERGRFNRGGGRPSRDRENSSVPNEFRFTRAASSSQRSRRSFSRDRSPRRSSPERWQRSPRSSDRDSQQSVCRDWSTSNTAERQMQSSINQQLSSADRQIKYSSQWPIQNQPNQIQSSINQQTSSDGRQMKNPSQWPVQNQPNQMQSSINQQTSSGGRQMNPSQWPVQNQPNQAFTSLATPQSLTNPMMKNPSIMQLPWAGENKANLSFADLTPTQSAAVMMANSQALQLQEQSQLLLLQERAQAMQLQEQSRILQLQERSRALQLQEQQHARVIHAMQRSRAMQMQNKPQAMTLQEQYRSRVRNRRKRPFSALQTSNSLVNKQRLQNQAGRSLGKRPSTMLSKGIVGAKKQQYNAPEHFKPWQQPQQQKRSRTVATWCAVEAGKPNLYFSGKAWPIKQIVGQRNKPLVAMFKNSALPDLPPNWKTGFSNKAPEAVHLPSSFADLFRASLDSKAKPKAETATSSASQPQPSSDTPPDLDGAHTSVSNSPAKADCLEPNLGTFKPKNTPSDSCQPSSTVQSHTALETHTSSAKSKQIPSAKVQPTSATESKSPSETVRPSETSPASASPSSTSTSNSKTQEKLSNNKATKTETTPEHVFKSPYPKTKLYRVSLSKTGKSSLGTGTQLQGKVNKSSSNTQAPPSTIQPRIPCPNPEIAPASLDLPSQRSLNKTKPHPEPPKLGQPDKTKPPVSVSTQPKTRSTQQKLQPPSKDLPTIVPKSQPKKTQLKKSTEPTNNINDVQENADSTLKKASNAPLPEVSKSSPKIQLAKPTKIASPDLPLQPNTRSVRSKSQVSTGDMAASMVGSSAEEKPRSDLVSAVSASTTAPVCQSNSQSPKELQPLGDRDADGVGSSTLSARLQPRKMPRLVKPSKTDLSQPHPKSVLGRLLSHSVYFQARSAYNRYRSTRNRSSDLKAKPSTLPEEVHDPVSSPSKLAKPDTCTSSPVSTTESSPSESQTSPARRKARGGRS